jgi:hypothetical protein
MNKRLNCIESIYVFFGYAYLLNTNSMEVHYLPDKTKHCWLNLMNPTNKVYLTEKQFLKYLKDGFNGKPINGCRWCLKEYDNG